MKLFLSLFFFCSLLLMSGGFLLHRQHIVLPSAEPNEDKMKKIRIQAKKAAVYANKHAYATDKVVLIDMSQHSGTKRFYLWDLKEDKAIESSLVAHGHCKTYREKVQFSNVSGSNCSSKGKYKIGKQYVGKFGKAYKLHGLEASNDKAFERFVVLHAYDCVPDEEGSISICMSEGCPTLSPNMMEKMIFHIEKSTKPMLLWIFD